MKLLAKVRLTIGTKLVSLIAALLITSIVSLVWISTQMFSEDNMALISKVNADTAESLANQARELFESTTDKMRVLGTVLIQEIPHVETKERIINEFFSKDKDFLFLFVNKHNQDGSSSIWQKAVSAELKSNNAESEVSKAFNSLASNPNFSMSQVAKGEVQIASTKLADGTAAIAIALPFIQSTPESFSHSLTAIVRQSKFVKAFGESDIITSFMVDRNGKLLAHPDSSRVGAGESVAHLAIVKEMLAGKFNNKQMRYFDGEPRLGAFRVVGFAGLGVVAEVPESKAFETTIRVKYRAMLLAVTILCISFFVGYIYSGTITWPIKQLVIAAGRIAEGDFDVNLKPKGQDEIAHLSTAFNEMARGLEERDKVKETFNKFHNKEIAEKLLSGEVKLGGERREATIFFSDVRGFTGMSESMQPEDVVVMLNEYMTRMVAIIRSFGGVVDKYVGDAIMALWGVPFGGPNDVENAVRACLAMREELAALNELRLSRGQPVLRIGMGLNTGQVIAGNIGSNEKMEYTVIGDSVNLASRIESMTKEYGTDFLISENVYEKVRDRFIVEPCKSAKVKGKAQAIQIYRVLGLYDEAGNKVIVETPYSSYAAEKSDKVVHEEAPTPITAAVSEIVEPASHVEVPGSPNIFTPEPTPTEVTAVEEPVDLSKTKYRDTPPQPEGAVQFSEPSVAIAVPTTSNDGATMGNAWYVDSNGDIYGPFTTDEVYTGIASKELLATMKTCQDLLKPNWVLLGEHPKFKEKFSGSTEGQAA
ncbi:MAG: adenylate/guanylate cyclase domain-containing protein [Bdellovibrionota bacterium]